MTTRYLKPEDIPFDFERAYKFLRVQKTSEKYQTMHDMVVRLHAEYLHCFEARYRYEIYRVAGSQSSSFSVLLDGGMSFTGKGIHTLLTHSRYAAVFLLTLGGRIDSEMKKLSVEDFTETYFLDGVASTMTQGVLHLLKHELQEGARKYDCEVSYRFSPGYTRWELQEQQKIFSLLNGEEIGMSLSETFFMEPQKSLSGVFGLRPCGVDSGFKIQVTKL
ncbi:MAG: hypothetical protein KGJ59_14750 [Bacteroidota bacterium]|nr:hypothetical protein [Bacteroidota bacterium]